MSERVEQSWAALWAGIGALALYGAAYVAAWSVVWSVPTPERDGLEWIFVFLMTFPWSLIPGPGGSLAIVHLGAAVNGALFAVLVSWTVRRLVLSYRRFW